ncbi:RNA polymerase sigma factor [Archangium lansingense]|uniref:Sigma-70 family RNA polymerase sigma factor n=1 Tax=Archangium lansingense TaxID=2995310 RepID=A0ABT4AMU8_9BACT|nr:sigma-70 family RNA polymerase sigma factor [Archangium lansinium]MCY1083000.1 sigma-70 family RNA polymerase sigma factor [Archangium lansinium]
MSHLFAVRIPLVGGASSAEEAERRLLTRARRGDPVAFRSLFEQHSPAVWRFLRDLFRDDAAADEATQETFVRAHGKLGALRDDARLASWLLGIARHIYLESRRSRGTHLDIADQEHESLLEAALPSPTPEDMLLDREMEGLLAEALGELREERRSALLLRIDHGLAYEDIAQVMGWSLPKVKNEIHRARLQLRERLSGHIGNGGHS